MKNRSREKMHKAIVEGVEDVLDRVEDRYENINERSSQSIDQMKEHASNMYGTMKSKAAHTREQTRQYVQKYPEKSLLIAAGAGALSVLFLKMIIKKKRRYHRQFNDRY